MQIFRTVTLAAIVAFIAGCASSPAPKNESLTDGDAKPFVAPDSGDEISLPVIEADVEPSNRAYAFAHAIVPTVLLKAPPDRVEAQFFEGSGNAWLRAQWEAIGGDPGLPGLVSREVELEIEGRAVLIEMPPVEDSPEAYFALLALTPSGTHYFTLEKSLLVPTVLGGWTFEDGALVHLNFGEGTPGDAPAEFVDAVERLLSED